MSCAAILGYGMEGGGCLIRIAENQRETGILWAYVDLCRVVDVWGPSSAYPGYQRPHESKDSQRNFEKPST